MTRPDIPVVPLRQVAEILGVSVEAARSSLRHHGIRSGYPLAAVEWLADNRPGQGARTDLKETTMRTIESTVDRVQLDAETAESISNAVNNGAIVRESYSLDETGRKEYHLRVIEFDFNGVARWAVVHDDPAEHEILDSASEDRAVAYYEKQVRDLTEISGWFWSHTDVTGVGN